MNDEIIALLVVLFGAGGAWRYIQMAEANRLLAEQATKTIEGKDREIAALALENEEVKQERDDLLDYLTRPDTQT